MPEKILIVDDEIDTLRLVGMMLESKDYVILAANSGEKALSMAQSEQPDLILLDIMMPGIDGYEVTRRLRESEQTSHIPIIMFTAKAGMEDKIAGLELGADAYLTKPISTRELLAQIKVVMARVSIAREQAPVPAHGDMLAVLAPKGGMGVSTVVLNLGIALHDCTKKEIIVADFRPGQGSIGLELGYKSPEGLNRMLQLPPNEISRRAVENEIVNHSSGIRLLLSSSQPRDGRYVTAVGNFEAIARLLPQLADYVVLDLGSGLTPVSEKVLRYCNQVLVILEPVPQSVQQSKVLIQDLASLGLGEGQIILIMVNRVRSSIQLTMTQVQDQLGQKILTVFTPEPELAYQASLQNVPMMLLQPAGLTAQQFNNLAGRIAHRSS